MTNLNEPGVYVKGDKIRHAETKADAVAARFDGFKRDGDLPAEVAAETSEQPTATGVEHSDSGVDTYTI